MTENTVTLKLESKTAIELLLVLETATKGYSTEFPPERITRLREVMKTLDESLEKLLLEE